MVALPPPRPPPYGPSRRTQIAVGRAMSNADNGSSDAAVRHPFASATAATIAGQRTPPTAKPVSIKPIAVAFLPTLNHSFAKQTSGARPERQYAIAKRMYAIGNTKKAGAEAKTAVPRMSNPVPKTMHARTPYRRIAAPAGSASKPLTSRNSDGSQLILPASGNASVSEHG